MDVRIQNLSKEFGNVATLANIDLLLRSGDLTALLGPSGSGKTTLLRLIAGLVAPSAGHIYFGEEDASSLSVRERNVGFVFQHYALFRHMTVFENVAFGLQVMPRMARPTSFEIRKKISELLDLVQLSGLESRYPAQLSGGQSQRVALARALAIEPRILLLDEPFGALDAKVRRELRRWLRDIHDKTGHTTVFVTHDQEEALELADRVLVMEAGKIVQDGPPDSIYDSPASPFVFSFIGESGEIPVALEGGEIYFMGKRTGLYADGKGPATLFFRPHDAEIAEEEGEGEGLFKGHVLSSRRHQHVARMEIDLGLKLGHDAKRIEIAAPVEKVRRKGSAIAFRLRRFRVFPRIQKT